MYDLAISSRERYDRFVRRVRARGEVWGLESPDGWAVSPSNLASLRSVMPFWSDRAYAARCASAEWSEYRPSAIPLTQFVDTWLPGMVRDGILVGTNWNVDLIGEEVDPTTLRSELAE